ncbi:protein SGT1 homolog [Erethizon dorsatum]
MAAAAAGPATPQRFFQSFSDSLIDEDPQAALEVRESVSAFSTVLFRGTELSWVLAENACSHHFLRGTEAAVFIVSTPELTKALEQKPDDAQYYCQRAYCHILLGNYCDGVADAKTSLKLHPNNTTAMLRKGICEYHEKNYAAALETFTEGQKLDSADANFVVWIKRCREAQNGSESEMACTMCSGLFNRELEVLTQADLGPFTTAATDCLLHLSELRYDWYQTESQVIITLMIKNVQKNDVNVEFSEKELSALVKLPSGEDYNLQLRLLHPIIPEQSTFKVLSTKIEIKMKKPEAVRWEKLEGQGDVPSSKQFIADVKNLYPSSSHYTRNWDKLVGEIKEEEKNEKLEGDAALNKLFQQIYSDGSDEVKRAMNKSFMESGGTVLSTNWSDVGTRKVEINPPDDMEWKKY